ncbi:MAG: hypothetical protein JNM79_24805 [Burkholderiales bacterium]|nr:hypothetical protein [Burkholderiales bacterium]
MATETASISIAGPRDQVRAMRKHVRDAFRSQGESVRDAPSAGAPAAPLALAVSARRGIPYPQLVEASARLPECVITIRLSADGRTSETVLTAGGVSESGITGPASDAAPVAVRLSGNGTLALLVALAEPGEVLAGYCATHAAETYFQVRGNASQAQLLTIEAANDPIAPAFDTVWQGNAARPLAPAQPLTTRTRHALDHLAASVRERWLWFDHEALEATAVERARAAEAGREVRAINVKSRQLAALAAGLPAHNLSAEQASVVDLIAATWAEA